MLDPSLPSHLASDPAYRADFEPRAARLVLPRADLGTEVWVGGAHAAGGERIEDAHLDGAWLVDCSGDLPADFAALAARHIPRVFADTEAIPANYDRILALAAELAALLAAETGAPERLYVLCQQGMNRSALVAGRLLRALGASPEATIEAIRRGRPGALSNVTFVRLIHE